MLAPRVVDGQQRQLEQDTGRKDAKPTEESAKSRVVGDGEDTEIGSKVEVGPGKGLQDGKAEEEVS